MFGRATIRLGIGPHSSLIIFAVFSLVLLVTMWITITLVIVALWNRADHYIFML